VDGEKTMEDKGSLKISINKKTRGFKPGFHLGG